MIANNVLTSYPTKKVLGFAQTVASSAAVAKGFGKSLSLLNDSQTVQAEKVISHVTCARCP